MRELEIALAIALSFLIFSTFASMILELFYRLLNSRFDGLEKMLSELCRKELPSFVENNDIDSWAKNMTAHFIKDTKNNHTMTTSQFIERLAATNIGKEITKGSHDELTVMVNHFGRRYDAFCEEATQSFKKNSEKYTMFISVAMALILNINVVTLGNTFIENRALTNELVAQTTVIMERAEQQQKNLHSGDESIKEFAASLNSLRESYQGMEKMQLPIGWSRSSLQFFETEAAKWVCKHEPDNVALHPYDKCKDSLGEKILFWTVSSIVWVITTLITSLLIGLGGPFWFDVVKRISAFRSLLSSTATDKNQTQEHSSGNDKASQKDLVKIFEETVKAGKIIANTHQPYLPPAPSRVRIG